MFKCKAVRYLVFGSLCLGDISSQTLILRARTDGVTELERWD